MKKEYILPNTKLLSIDTLDMIAGTTLDSDLDNQNITTTEDPYDGEFGAKGNAWDE